MHMPMIAAACPYLAGCHPHHVARVHHPNPGAGLGIIGAIIVFLIARGLITGKWG